jgi:GH15 family glucan-1,4-alpha-glucosidase
MPLAIEDYALLGDCTTAALVGRDGSIDWLCWPRFDSEACFAALLGTPEHGRWLLAPAESGPPAKRSYRDGSLVLDTVFERDGGTVRVTDFMVPERQHSTVVRLVEGLSGRVPMRMEVALRFGYGLSVPWVRRLEGEHGGISATAGPERVAFRASEELRGEDRMTVAEFVAEPGKQSWFVLRHGPSHEAPAPALSPHDALRETERFWHYWSERCKLKGPRADLLKRSVIVLKALSYALTGGIVAAATTSLPEQLGGTRNWDYRFCWLRDATLTLDTLMEAGYQEEASAWADWLHRSVAGSPDQVQIMYGLGGERRLAEWEVPWLPGYQGARPVRIGNAASDQLQLDVYGEVMDALHRARHANLLTSDAWSLQRALLNHLEQIWEQPDEGLWETRGGRQQFTFSKVMAWVAFDRAITDAETCGLDGPLDRWREVRARIKAQVLEKGFDAGRNTFTQVYGGTALDASLLLIPFSGFLPHGDPRVLGTIAAVERELVQDGFVLRYRTDEAKDASGGKAKDGLPPGEGAFLACSFWLVSALAVQGRREEAQELFDRLCALSNDLGLLAEEYDTKAKRQVGNFPQAFSHLALVQAALTLGDPESFTRQAP